MRQKWRIYDLSDKNGFRLSSREQAYHRLFTDKYFDGIVKPRGEPADAEEEIQPSHTWCV